MEKKINRNKKEMQWSKLKKIRKYCIIVYFVVGGILILVAGFKKALNNDEYGTANHLMDRMPSNSSKLYDELELKDYTAAQMLHDGVPLNYETETNKLGMIGDIALALKTLYEERDYTSLFAYVDTAYLNDKGYYLYLDTFKQHHDGIVKDMNEYSLEIKDCIFDSSRNYIIKGTYLEIVKLPNGERGYRETDQEFKYTINLKEDGGFSYLPFDETDLFVVSDYGVTRLNFNIGE